MNSLDDSIVKFIKKVRSRLTEQTVLSFVGYGSIGGLFVAVVCSVVALFVPWYHAPLYASIAVVLGFIAGMVLGIVKRPDMKEAALRLDAHGFHERLITSYGLVGKNDVYSRMQKQDTVRRLSSFQIRKLFPIRFRYQVMLIILALAGAFIGITKLPTKAKEQAEAYHEVAAQVKEEVKKVEETIEHISKMEDLTEDEKQDVLATLEDAKEELQSVTQAEELSKTKERISVIADQKAGEVGKRAVREELQTLAEAMSEREKTEEQKLAEDLEDLQKDLQTLSDATSDSDRQAIANQLQQLGQKTGNQTMLNAAQQVANNTISQNTLEQTQQAVANEQQNAQANSQMASSQNGQSQSGQNQSGQNQSGQNQNGQNQNGQNQNGQNQNGQNQNGQNQNGQNQNGQNQNGQNQNGQNQNGQNQNGQNGQNGQNQTGQNQNAQNQNGQNQNGQNQSGQNQNGQNQSGQGQNGQNGQGQNGQGQGSGQGENGQSGGQGGGYDTGSDQGYERENDASGSMVTIPNLLSQDNDALNGKVNPDGSAITQSGGQAWSGNSVDYTQVIGDYSQNAYNKVESARYPKGVQDVVKSYFDDLNE